MRASGRSNPSTFYPGRNRPHLEDAVDFEESFRPNKRRRHDAASQHFDLTEEVSVKSGSSPGTQSGVKHKSSGWNPRQHEEFRGVEESIKVDRSPRSTRRAHRDRRPSTDSYDEQFTSRATQQRRSLNNTQERPRQVKIAAIEIPKSKSTTSEKVRDEPEFGRQKRLSSTGTRCVLGRGESPDELQGEATTQPIPKYLSEKQDYFRPKLQENRTSPMRKRSLSDIKPTDFAGSSNQPSKKIKRNEKRPRDIYLELHSLRFGSVNRRKSKEATLLLHVSQDKLELEEKEVEILLRHVRTVVQGTRASRKVRLCLSGLSAKDVDLEFIMAHDKERLVERLRDMQIKVQDKDEYVHYIRLCLIRID